MTRDPSSPGVRSAAWLALLITVGAGCSPPQSAAPPGEQKDGYFEARVFFATDRAVAEEGDTVTFTGRRGSNDALTYGEVRVSLPDDREAGEIPSPAWYRVWDRDDPTDFVLVLSAERYADQGEFTAKVGQLLGQPGRDDVLLFIHGFNVGFEDAAKRTAQLAYDLKFAGAPLFYSWPSLGQVDEYATDEDSVQWTRIHLERFLRLTLTELGAKNVHVIAHSMGNRALMAALSNFDPSGLPEGSARLRQIVLAAPDVDVDLFRQLASNFPGKADRITLYASERDKALLLSERFHQYSRAGNSIVLVDGVDTIDASTAETGFLDHSYFGASLLPDIFGLLRENKPPDERPGMTRVVGDNGGLYWKLDAEALR